MLMKRENTSDWFGQVGEDFPPAIEPLSGVAMKLRQARSLNSEGFITSVQDDTIRLFSDISGEEKTVSAESEITLIMKPGCGHTLCSHVVFNLSLN